MTSRTLLICRIIEAPYTAPPFRRWTFHQDIYSFQVLASWVLNVSFIEILQTCYKQSLHSIWMSFTRYLNSYLQIWRPVHFWRPAMVLRYTFCFDPYWLKVWRQNAIFRGETVCRNRWQEPIRNNHSFNSAFAFGYQLRLLQIVTWKVACCFVAFTDKSLWKPNKVYK